MAFSLGGGIVMSFTALFPYLVNSIILLAPVGILRDIPDDYKNIFFRFSSVVPSIYLRIVLGKLLGVNLSAPSIAREQKDDNDPEMSKDTETIGKRTLDIGAIVQWQFDYHKGFMHSFISTVRYGPIMHQESDWKKTCDIIKGEDVTGPMRGRVSKLRHSKILVIFGDSDAIVNATDVSEDMSQLLGNEHVEFKTVPGNHGFPISSSADVIKHICAFWDI